MQHVLANRGVQASAAAGVIIATTAAIAGRTYPAAFAIVAAAWLVATVIAVVQAIRTGA